MRGQGSWSGPLVVGGDANSNIGNADVMAFVVSADAADDVMITADLHGHRRNFRSILRHAALSRHPRRHLVLQEVCHGGPTYGNGGCRSHEMLEAVARLTVLYPGRVHFLLSNHELAEWQGQTIRKDGESLTKAFLHGLVTAYGYRADEMHAALCAFIASSPLAVSLPDNVLLSHSVPDRIRARGFDTSIFERPIEASDCQEGGSVYRLLWGRDYQTSNVRAFADLMSARFLVNGHTRATTGVLLPNPFQAILDCSARPAAFMLLPARTPLTPTEIVNSIRILPA